MATDVHSRGRSWLAPPSWLRGLRAGLAPWILLAVAGWTVAGVAAAAAVRAHQASDRLASLAGLTPVIGPGIEITLSDSTRTLGPDQNPSEALVQDSDLLLLEMLLWYGGARGVAVNGARITARTTILSSGPTIVIDGRRMVAPFHITAVGDPQLLLSVLQTRGGFLDRMHESGLGVNVATRSRVVVAPWSADSAAAQQ
jgi:uncharacterized protein YlxW (UPF0749 family)